MYFDIVKRIDIILKQANKVHNYKNKSIIDQRKITAGQIMIISIKRDEHN